MRLSNKITNNGCHHLKGDDAYSSKSVPTFQRILVPQLATVTKFQYPFTRLHNVTTQKAAEFIATAVRISNETNIIRIAMSVCLCVCLSILSITIHSLCQVVSTGYVNNFIGFKFMPSHICLKCCEVHFA